MDVENEVVARIEPPGHSFRLDQRRRIRLPEEEMAVRVEGVAGVEQNLHAGNAASPVRRMLHAKAACAVDEDVGVMHHLCRSWVAAGVNLHRADEVALSERIRQDEVAEDVRAARGQREGLCLLQDQIWFAHLPGCVEDRSLWSILRIAFRHSSLKPLTQSDQVLLRQAAIIGKVSVARFRQPGRHITRLCHRNCLRAPAPGVSVSQQAEGARAAGMMAACAVFVEDGSNIMRPGRLDRTGRNRS